MRFRVVETSEMMDHVSKCYVDDFRKAGLKVEGEYTYVGEYKFYEDEYVDLDTAEDIWKLRQAAECEIIIGSNAYRKGADESPIPVIEIYDDYRE